MSKEKEIIRKTSEQFLKYGIKSVSMDDIARNLGISKKTLYQYFENKETLISQSLLQHIEEEKATIASIRQNSKDALEEMLNIASFVIKLLRQMHPSVMFDLKKYYLDCWKLMEQLQKDHIYKVIYENIAKGIEEELYRKDLNPDIIAKLYVARNHAIVSDDFFPYGKYSREELYEEILCYHIRGIASQKGIARFENQFKTMKK